MKNTNHTTAKILLGLAILGLIFLFNTLLYLIELI
jgi:hypothetical protein